MRQVYYNSENNRVLVDGFGYHSPKTLEAWDDGNEVSIRFINTSRNLVSEPYTNFSDIDDVSHGSTKQEVIDSLNVEFNKDADLEWSFTNEITIFVNDNQPGQLASVNSLLAKWWKEVRMYEKKGNKNPLENVINTATGTDLTILNIAYTTVPPQTLKVYMLSILI